MCGVLKSKYIYIKIIINSYTKINKKIYISSYKYSIRQGKL